jgi:hypothetical protein
VICIREPVLNFIVVIRFITVVPLPPCMRQGGEGYSSNPFLNSALDGGECSPSLPAALYPPVQIGQEAGWAPEPVWTQRLEEKSFAFAGNGTPFLQSVVRHYTD